MDDDPAEEDEDLEVELDVVDVVSFALAVVSLGFNALVSDSILMATAPVLRGRWLCDARDGLFNPSFVASF